MCPAESLVISKEAMGLPWRNGAYLKVLVVTGVLVMGIVHIVGQTMNANIGLDWDGLKR